MLKIKQFSPGLKIKLTWNPSPFFFLQVDCSTQTKPPPHRWPKYTTDKFRTRILMMRVIHHCFSKFFRPRHREWWIFKEKLFFPNDSLMMPECLCWLFKTISIDLTILTSILKKFLVYKHIDNPQSLIEIISQSWKRTALFWLYLITI